MSRNNFPLDNDRELNALISQYELAKAENRALYLDGDQFADIAEKYANDHEFANAEEVINYGLELHPDNTALLIEQGYLYLDTDRLDLARQVVDSIVEDYDFEVILLKSEILLSNGELDATDQLLNTAKEKDELNTIIDIAYLYLDMGYPEQALSWIKSGAEKYHHDEAYIAVNAEYYRNIEGQEERAMYYYNQLIDIDPYNPVYWTGLARCHLSLTEYDKCIEAADFALAADESFGEAYSVKAHALFYLDNEDGAIAEYEKALKHSKFTSEVNLIFMGLAYFNKKEWNKSIECLNIASKIIESRATSSLFLPDIFHHLAACYLRKKEYELANTLNNKARAMNPSSKEYLIFSGLILLETNHLEIAEEFFNEIAQQDTEGSACELIGQAYLDYHHFDKAIQFFEQAYKLDPTLSEVNTLLAILYLQKHDSKKFFEHNSKAETPLTYESLEQELKKQIDDLQEETIKELLQVFKEEMEKNKNNNNNTN